MDLTDALNTLTDISLHLQSIADSLGRNDAAEALASVDASLANISGSLESIADSLERLDKAAWALIALLERVEALLADRN